PGLADARLVLALEVASGDLLDDGTPTPHLEQIRDRRQEIERVVGRQRSLVFASLPAKHEDTAHRVLEPFDDLARHPRDEPPHVEADRCGGGWGRYDVGRDHEV